MVLRIAIFFLLFCTSANAKHLHPEKYYQNIWCNEHSGKQEVILSDNTRIDCLTSTHAIEFDFATKWAEAIGQSLHYSNLTNKKAGIVLIVENKSDFKHYEKIKPLCLKHNISLWHMQPPKQTQETTKFYNIEDIIELVINFIKMLIKLFANFQ